MPQPPAAPPAPDRTADAADDTSWGDAARWWEPRRVLYNLVLSAIFVALVARTWMRIRPELDASAVVPLFVLAVLANVCYSAAYVADFALQAGFLGAARNRARLAVWVLGTLFAVLIETYWYLDEILPPLR